MKTQQLTVASVLVGLTLASGVGAAGRPVSSATAAGSKAPQAFDGGAIDAYEPPTTRLSVPECAEWMNHTVRKDCASLRAQAGDGGAPAAAPGVCEKDLAAGNLRFCQWYGGMDLPARCNRGYKLTATATTTLDGLPTGRPLCVRDTQADGGRR